MEARLTLAAAKDKDKKDGGKKKKKSKSKDGKERKRNATLPASLGAMKEENREAEKRGQTLPTSPLAGQTLPAGMGKKQASVVCLGWQTGRLHITDEEMEDNGVDSPARGRKRKKAFLQREARIELPVMLEQNSSPRIPSGVSFSVVMTKKQHTFISSVQQVNSLRQNSSLYRSMASLDGSQEEAAAQSSSDGDSSGDSPTPFMMANEDGSTQLMLYASSVDLPIAIPIEAEPDAKAIQKAIAELKKISFAQMTNQQIFQTLADLGLPQASRPVRIDAAPSLSQLQKLLPTTLNLPALAGDDGSKESGGDSGDSSMPHIEALELSAKDNTATKECEDAKESEEAKAERMARKQREKEEAARKALEEEPLEVALLRAKEMLAWTDQALSNQNPAHVAKFLTAMGERASLLHKKWEGQEGVHEVLKSVKARLDEGQQFVGFLQAENTTWLDELSCEEDSYSGSEFSFEEDDAAELGGFTL